MSSTVFPIPLSNGQHVVDVQNLVGYHQIMLGFTQYPSAGRMAIEFKPVGVDGWFPVEEAQNLDLTLPRYAIAYGAIDKFRFTISGLTGGAGLHCEVVTMGQWPGVGLPPGLFTGDRAMTVQFYDEANKKRGVQWEASRLVTIPDNTEVSNVYSILLTGSKPVDLKSRSLGYTGLGIIGRIYKAPSYTGGTPDPWFNMNPRYLGTQPEAQLLVGFTLNTKGTKCGADIIAIGPASNQSRGATPREYGSNRILDEPNTAYLLEIASNDPASQQVMARLEMYEGGLDLPRN